MEQDVDPHARALSSQAKTRRRRLLASVGLAALAGVGVGLLAAGIYAIASDENAPPSGVRIDTPIVEVSVPPTTPPSTPVVPGAGTAPATTDLTIDPMVACLEKGMEDIDLPPGTERDEAFARAQEDCISFLYGE